MKIADFLNKLLFLAVSTSFSHCAGSNPESELDITGRDGTELPEAINISPEDYSRFVVAPPIGYFLTTAKHGLNFRDPENPATRIIYSDDSSSMSHRGMLPFNTRIRAVGYADAAAKWLLVFRVDDKSEHPRLGMIYKRWTEISTEDTGSSPNSQSWQPAGQVPDLKDYKSKYKLDNPFTKLVDNHGNGFDSLYGVRNFRVVLHGIFYRGGANNVYNKFGVRENENPLPAVGLKHLCENGFTNAIYFYPKNFRPSEIQTSCQSASGSNSLNYQQISVLTGDNFLTVLSMIFDRIQSPEKGPIYGHCWNGWHASGYISALALRQFCNFSAATAEGYWVKNTDGASVGYSAIRDNIRNFQPLEKWKIAPEIQAKICPNNSL